jgi:AcrR family transcriptional regulator
MTTVTQSHTSLRERKKRATRARIIEAAVRIFGERGLEAPTVEEIALAAETGKGTIYNYFRTKEEIVVAFMVGLEERLQEKARKLARRRGSLASILADFALTHLKLKTPYRDFVRVVVTQVALSPPEVRKHFLEIKRLSDPPLVELFTELQARGALRKDVRVEDLVIIFETLQVGFTLIWLNDSPPYHGTRQVVETAFCFFVEGIAAPAAGAAPNARCRNHRQR